MESFYRTLKRELIQDANYDNPEQARMDLFKTPVFSSQQKQYYIFQNFLYSVL